VFFHSWHLFLLTFSYLANKIHPVHNETCKQKNLHHKTCTKYFPALLRTTKVPQTLPSTSYYKACTSTSRYYFVLQDLHRVQSSAAPYDTACTNSFPVLLCTTKLAHRTSQYCFVLQDLHKVLPGPSTTSYDKICAKYFPVLLRTSTLAQSTSQYYFVRQNLRKVLPSTTLYYTTCTKYFPVLLRTTKYFPVLLRTKKLAQPTSQYQ